MGRRSQERLRREMVELAAETDDVAAPDPTGTTGVCRTRDRMLWRKRDRKVTTSCAPVAKCLRRLRES